MTQPAVHALADACDQLTSIRPAADAALAARLARMSGAEAPRLLVEPPNVWLDLLVPVLTAPSDAPELLASIRMLVQWAAARQYGPLHLSTVMRALDWVLRDLLPTPYTIGAAAAFAERAMLLERVAARSITPRDTAIASSSERGA